MTLILNQQKQLKIYKKAKNVRLEDMKKWWREKPLQGNCPSRTDNADADRATPQQWLGSSNLKGKSGDFILAAQYQSISTWAHQSRILNNGTDPNCRPCIQSGETVDHTVLVCPTIVNTEYLQRHDRVASLIHWI